MSSTFQTKEYELIRVNISDLIFDKENPNQMTQKQMAALRKSMQTWGYLTPVIIDQNNKIADGEHRALVYKELGMETIPAFQINLETDSDRLMIRQVMNKLRGEHDRQLDSNELATIFQRNNNDLATLSQLIDQRKEDLEHLITAYHPDIWFTRPEQDFDHAKAIEEIVPTTQLGDLYQLGEHRLICADSTDQRSITKLLDGKTADICFTSPPYNAGNGNLRQETNRIVKAYLELEDTKTDEEYFEFLKDSLTTNLEHCYECYYNIGLIGMNKRPVIEFLYEFRNQYKDLLYWIKDNQGVPDPNEGHLQNRAELILIFSKHDNSKTIRHHTFSLNLPLSNIITGPKQQRNEFSLIHRATFPLYLPSHVIDNCTYEGDIILEPFAGTGTTIIAAEQKARKCFAVEIDPHYVDVILQRWASYTGKDPVRVSDGKTWSELKGK